MKNIKIAITGATGLVGSHLVEYLAHKDYAVKALIRSTASAAPFMNGWSTLNIEIRQANILKSSELRQALTGVDVLIHAAGIVDPYAPPEEITAVNVAGTQTALQTAIELNIKQFIFISSLSVITGNTDQYNSPEESPLVLCGEAYADSKVQAEQIINNDTYKNKIGLTIIRPGFIYGPRERAWLPQLIKAIASSRAILVDNGSKETNVIYIENLCRAIETAILNEITYGQIYNLTDGQHITKKQLFDSISDGLGLPRVKKTLPSWLIKPIFTALSAVVSTLPIEKRKKLSRFSMAAYRLIGINQGFSISKAQRDLNYTNPISFSQGMANTLKSFQQPTITTTAKTIHERSPVTTGETK